MKPRGEDVASGVREWMKDSIRTAPTARQELGRVFVGVSAGTLVLFAAALKFGEQHPRLDTLTVTCFVVLLVSMIAGLRMAIPPVLNISEHMEVYEEHHRLVYFTRRLTIFWIVFWLIGFALGVARLFSG